MPTKTQKAPKLSLIAVLAPPSAEEASSSYRQRAPGFAALADMLAKIPSGRVLAKGPQLARVSFDTGDGRNVLVTLRPQKMQLEAELRDEKLYDEEHGAWEEDDTANDAVLDLADDLLSPFQAKTGWYVTSDHLLTFDPTGACESCGVECFEWQEKCAQCGEPVNVDEDDDEPGTAGKGSRYQMWARDLVSELIDGELLELSSKGSRRAVEATLAELLSKGVRTSALFARLLEHPDVEDILGDDKALKEVVEKTDPAAEEPERDSDDDEDSDADEGNGEDEDEDSDEDD
jgi:hypothetical protein